MKLCIAMFTLLLAPAAFAQSREEAAIRKTHSDFADAWNKHDAKAMAAVWADDGDLINPLARTAKGRAEVEKLLAEEQATAFATSHFTATITAIRLIKHDLAIVDATFEAAGAKSPDGKEMTMKGLYTTVMTRKGRNWQVLSARAMTPPPAPPAKK